jgi:sulfite exporter TauE/SafE
MLDILIASGHSCCHEPTGAETIPQAFASFGEIGVVLALFSSGLAGSFTHCIGMCGPIALGQVSMRLMNIPPGKMSQIDRLKSSAILPYYFGKAITYAILGALASTFAATFKQYPVFKYIALIALLIAALLFIRSAVSGSFTIWQANPKSYWGKLQAKLGKFLSNKLPLNRLSSYGISGFGLGMLLGLIPCGLVYAALVMATAGTDNTLLAAFSMFAFGIGTVPGLFLVGYFGQEIINRFRKAASLFYRAMMFINALIILNYVIRNL